MVILNELVLLFFWLHLNIDTKQKKFKIMSNFFQNYFIHLNVKTEECLTQGIEEQLLQVGLGIVMTFLECRCSWPTDSCHSNVSQRVCSSECSLELITRTHHQRHHTCLLNCIQVFFIAASASSEGPLSKYCLVMPPRSNHRLHAVSSSLFVPFSCTALVRAYSSYCVGHCAEQPH